MPFFYNDRMLLLHFRKMDDQPFLDFKISSHECLDTLEGRSECPKCKRSRKYYCYTCFVPVDKLQDLIPNVKVCTCRSSLSKRTTI